MSSSVRTRENSGSLPIRRSGLTGWPPSRRSALLASKGVLGPIAKGACRGAGQPIAPFISTTTSTSLRTTDHLTIDRLEQMAAKLQSSMVALEIGSARPWAGLPVPPHKCHCSDTSRFPHATVMYRKESLHRDGYERDKLPVVQAKEINTLGTDSLPQHRRSYEPGYRWGPGKDSQAGARYQ
jgi:hypothetical protein